MTSEPGHLGLLNLTHEKLDQMTEPDNDVQPQKGLKGIEQNLSKENRAPGQGKSLMLFNYLILKPRKLRINLVAALLLKWQK